MRLLSIVSFLFLSACQTPNVGMLNKNVSIKLSDSQKFPAQSQIQLAIYDGGLMDTSMMPIFTKSKILNGDKSAINFKFSVSAADLKKLSMPSYSIRLEKNGRLVAINLSAIRVAEDEKAQTIIIDKVPK